jgi:hypothetical protein
MKIYGGSIATQVNPGSRWRYGGELSASRPDHFIPTERVLVPTGEEAECPLPQQVWIRRRRERIPTPPRNRTPIFLAVAQSLDLLSYSTSCNLRVRLPTDSCYQQWVLCMESKMQHMISTRIQYRIIHPADWKHHAPLNNIDICTTTHRTCFQLFPTCACIYDFNSTGDFRDTEKEPPMQLLHAFPSRRFVSVINITSGSGVCAWIWTMYSTTAHRRLIRCAKWEGTGSQLRRCSNPLHSTISLYFSTSCSQPPTLTSCTV